MRISPRIAGLFAVLLAGGASGAMAQTNTSNTQLPRECRMIEQRQDGTVVAECSTQGGERASAIRINECRSNLSVRDGVLACSGTTATVGPLRTGTQQTGIGGLLASVLGTQQPSDAQNTDWVDAARQTQPGQNYQNGGYGQSGGWQPMEAGRADFERRLSEARNARVISLAESTRLRSDWQTLARLEAQYRRNGLDARETADLDTRMQAIERRLGRFGQQGQTQVAGNWAQLETRIDAGERNRSLNANQLERLRTEHGDLVRLDAAWRRAGLGANEQAYLTRRQGELAARIEQMERRR